MKNILFLVLAIAFTQDAHTQALRFGLKAGAGVSNLDFSAPDDPDNTNQVYYAGLWYQRKSEFRPAFLIGSVLEYDLTKDFLLSTGVNFHNKNSRVQGPDNSSDYEHDFRLNLLYLQVPLQVHYRRAGFFIGAGPYLGFCLSGKWKNEVTLLHSDQIVDQLEEKVIFGDDPEQANLRRLDFGLRRELGYAFKTVRLSLAYDHGLINNVPTGVNANNFQYEGKLLHQAFYATVTYYWLAK